MDAYQFHAEMLASFSQNLGFGWWPGVWCFADSNGRCWTESELYRSYPTYTRGWWVGMDGQGGQPPVKIGRISIWGSWGSLDNFVEIANLWNFHKNLAKFHWPVVQRFSVGCFWPSNHHCFRSSDCFSLMWNPLLTERCLWYLRRITSLYRPSWKTVPWMWLFGILPSKRTLQSWRFLTIAHWWHSSMPDEFHQIWLMTTELCCLDLNLVMFWQNIQCNGCFQALSRWWSWIPNSDKSRPWEPTVATASSNVVQNLDEKTLAQHRPINPICTDGIQKGRQQ